uniref:Uncharacterized protein n=1 Tax=Romanomermis culicivorax TaxID=13658 RepID=A0A915J5Z1_ROMCU
MPNYLRSVAQQGKNPELRDACERKATAIECERIATAIAVCNKEILPQKSTNLLVVSGAGSKGKPQDTTTPPLTNQSAANLQIANGKVKMARTILKNVTTTIVVHTIRGINALGTPRLSHCRRRKLKSLLIVAIFPVQ